MSESEPNFYEILNVRMLSDHNEIKRAYQRLALLHHPDKQQSGDDHPPSPSPSVDSSEMFIKITKAWETLANASARDAYDAELFQSRAESPTAHDTLDEENDFKLNRSSSSSNDDKEHFFYTYQCRCGAECPVDNDDLVTISSSRFHREHRSRWCYYTCDDCSHCVRFRWFLLCQRMENDVLRLCNK